MYIIYNDVIYHRYMHHIHIPIYIYTLHIVSAFLPVLDFYSSFNGFIVWPPCHGKNSPWTLRRWKSWNRFYTKRFLSVKKIGQSWEMRNLCFYIEDVVFSRCMMRMYIYIYFCVWYRKTMISSYFIRVQSIPFIKSLTSCTLHWVVLCVTHAIFCDTTIPTLDQHAMYCKSS